MADISKVRGNLRAKLNSSINAGATSLTLNNDFASKSVESDGYLAIGEQADFSDSTYEVVRYSSFTDNGDGTSTFDGLTRGLDNTTDQDWDSGTTVGTNIPGPLLSRLPQQEEDLDMNNNSVNNPDTVDGVDVSSHSSRHANGGSDQISQLDNSENLSDEMPRDGSRKATGNFDFDSNSITNLFSILGSAQSSAPSTPSAGDLYIDDGTNTDSGNETLRIYNGASWVDLALVSELFSGAHSDLSGIGSSDHHAKTVSADINHDSISGVSANDHHNPANQDVDSVDGYDIQKDGSDAAGIINFKTS